MEKERVRVATTEGERSVEIIRRVGVWAFHRSPFYESRHVVTHVPTGLAAHEGTAEVCRVVLDELGQRLATWQSDATWQALRCTPDSGAMENFRAVRSGAIAKQQKES